jgi:serine/threonine-protein kinase
VTGASAVREVYGERLVAEGRAGKGIPLLELAERDDLDHPRDDFDLRVVRWRLGDALDRVGRTAEARTALAWALADGIAHVKPDRQPLLAIRERWGRFLLDHGDAAGGVVQFDEVVRQGRDRRWTHVALAHAGLARVALERHDAAAALRESATALDLWDHRQGFYDVRMGPYLQRIRADALAAVGRRDEGQRLEDAAWAASEKFDAPESPTRRHRTLARGP